MYICNFFQSKSSNFSILIGFRDAFGYIKKVWKVNNVINTLYRAVWHAFYRFSAIKVGQNDEISSYNSMCYKMKLFKYV